MTCFIALFEVDKVFDSLDLLPHFSKNHGNVYQGFFQLYKYFTNHFKIFFFFLRNGSVSMTALNIKSE